MLLRAINLLRCRFAAWLLDRPWQSSVDLAKLAGPDTTGLIRHSPRRATPLRLPTRSHLINHQATVDELCARNSLRTLAAQIPREDEVVILDIGATASTDLGAAFLHHEWFSYVRCQARHPEQQSYTFGLNAAIPGLKASQLYVWLTDYVYPGDMLARYGQPTPRRPVSRHRLFASRPSQPDRPNHRQRRVLRRRPDPYRFRRYSGRSPALGMPVLVLRDVTERPEAIESGGAILVGCTEDRIHNHAFHLLSDSAARARMAVPRFPYGDGQAALRTLDWLATRPPGPPELVAP